MTVAAGLDIARYGHDMTAFAAIEDTKAFAFDEWGQLDTMSTVERVLGLHQAHEFAILGIDDNGVGGAVTDRLLDLPPDEVPFLVYPVNFGERANDAGRFHNKAAEMWWRMRESLDPANEEAISLPMHHPLAHRLAAQLTTAQHRRDQKERIWVDKTGTRGQQHRAGDPEPPSPDLGDALALALEAWSQYWEMETSGGGRRYHRESFLGRSAAQAYMGEER